MSNTSTAIPIDIPIETAMKPPAMRYLIAGTAIGMTALVLIPSGFLPYFAPGLLKELEGDKAKLGLLFAVASWGSLIGGFLGGILSDRNNPWNAFRILLFAVIVIFFIAGTTPTIGYFFPIVFLIMMTISAMNLSTMALLPSLMPKSPRRILSLQMAIGSLLGILLPVIATRLYNYAELTGTAFGLLKSIYTVFGIILVILAFIAAMIIRFLQDSRRDISVDRKANERLNFRKSWKILLIAAILGGLHGGTDTAVLTWAPTFFSSVFTERAFRFEYILSGYALSYVIGRFILSVLPEGRFEKPLIVLPGIIGSVLLFRALTVDSYIQSAIFYISASLFYGLEFPVLLGIVARRINGGIGTVIATSCGAAGIVAGLLSLMTGIIAERTGDTRSGIMLLPAGFLAFSLVAWLWYSRLKAGELSNRADMTQKENHTD